MFWKKFVITALFAFCFTALVFAGEAGGELRVSGHPGGLVTLPVFRMMETGVLKERGLRLSCVPWKNPDQLRAIVGGGQADAVAVPTNVAANFHNRGVELSMMNVSVWSVLWVVSADASVNDLGDLKGTRIAVPFRGDLPDVIFQKAARDGKLDVENFIIRYVATPLDAAQLLLAGKVDAAVLSEPTCSTAIHRSQKQKGAPKLFRSINLQKGEGLPLAGMAVLKPERYSPEILRAFHEEYARAMKWIVAHPEQAAALLARRFPSFEKEAAVESIKAAQCEARPATASRKEMERFFKELLKTNPALVGGKLPPDEFYLDVEQSDENAEVDK